ncbi:Fc.00g105480.m01.CDS01 [Cosmosporella sp. VM-42]
MASTPAGGDHGFAAGREMGDIQNFNIADPWNQQLAFGTSYEHGMEPYLSRLVELMLEAPEGRDNVIMDCMVGRKPVGTDRWSLEDIEKARGYLFIYTEKG